MPAEQLLTSVKAKWGGVVLKEFKKVGAARRKELDRISDEFSDPEELARFYIEPHCQTSNPVAVLQPAKPARQPALERVNEFLHGEPPAEKNGSHQMFILAGPGMGKTSLLLMIKLMYLTNFLPQKHGCELFKLDDTTLDRIAAIRNKADTVLLLDALNEDRNSWKRLSERLLELLRATGDFFRVIITCRTQFFAEVLPSGHENPLAKLPDGHQCPLLYLSPFTDEQVEEYIDKQLPQGWRGRLRVKAKASRADQEQTQHLINQLGPIHRCPMVLAHINTLLAAGNTAWNDYTVYEAILREWLDREASQLRKRYEKKKQVPSREELFIACVRLAEWMEGEGLREIEEEDFKRLIRQDANIAWLKEFNFKGHPPLRRNAKRAFHFSHYTIQEFLLVYALMKGALKYSLPVRVTDQLVRFLDLAGGFPQHTKRLDVRGFQVSRYMNVGGKSFPLRDKLGNKPGPELRLLPKGRIRLECIDKNRKQMVQEKQLANFAISRYPVTFAEFDVFCAATGWEKPKDEEWGRGRLPVVNVSWKDAMAYCKWLSINTGHAYRLPTEAEWEYACRAGTQTIYYFGDDESRLGDYAWYNVNAGGKAQLIGKKLPNAWDLYDMHGNVWEWCMDWYDERQLHRALRGGCWALNDLSARSAFRDFAAPNLRHKHIGFRVVREIKKKRAK